MAFTVDHDGLLGLLLEEFVDFRGNDFATENPGEGVIQPALQRGVEFSKLPEDVHCVPFLAVFRRRGPSLCSGLGLLVAPVIPVVSVVRGVRTPLERCSGVSDFRMSEFQKDAS